MAATETRSLRERREVVVLEHVAAENRHDVEATIATFDRPRYEVNGEPIEVSMAAIFEFEGDRLLCEKVYYDVSIILQQIGVLPEQAPS